jgi:glycyl-tRNA synthetase (class II)
VRHRDTQQQEKLNIEQVPAWLDKQIGLES